MGEFYRDEKTLASVKGLQGFYEKILNYCYEDDEYNPAFFLREWLGEIGGVVFDNIVSAFGYHEDFARCIDRLEELLSEEDSNMDELRSAFEEFKSRCSDEIDALEEVYKKLPSIIESLKSLASMADTFLSGDSKSQPESRLVQAAIAAGAVPIETRPRKGCPVHGLSNYAEFPNRKGFFYCKEYSTTKQDWTKPEPWKSRDGSMVRYYCKSVWKG
jgi:hypothetical protein